MRTTVLAHRIDAGHAAAPRTPRLGREVRRTQARSAPPSAKGRAGAPLPPALPAPGRVRTGAWSWRSSPASAEPGALRLARYLEATLFLMVATSRLTRVSSLRFPPI